MVLTLIKRNLKLYFRDHVAAFFSLLAVIVVVGIFILFLAQLQIDHVTEATGDISVNKISYLVHSWILAGLLSITTVTSVLSGYGSMVNDKEKKIMMGFRVAPVKAWVYPLVNVSSSFVIGVINSIITFIIYFISIYLITGYILTNRIFLLALTMIFFSALINASIFGLVCSYLKSNSSFSAVSILIGTVIGFINGIYVPLGSLNKSVISVLTLFPSLHVAALFRDAISLEAVNKVFANAPAEIREDYLINYGYTLMFNEKQISTWASLAYVTAFGLIGIGLMIRKRC